MVNYNASFWAGTIYTSSDEYLTKWFVYISGENIELAKAEVDTLLKMANVDSSIHWFGRLAIIETDFNISDFILNRAALTQRAGRVLYKLESIGNLPEGELVDSWREIIDSKTTFSVKTLCVNVNIESKKREKIEISLGTQIQRTTGASVNLRNAAIQILAILVDEHVFICQSKESILRSNLRNREPSKKPFFHPSMMNSSLARVMCNLAEVQPGNIVLDPFCGGGGILCEASYLGASVIGLDLNWKLLTGAKRNLTVINQNYCILQADARHIPISYVDSIVTDPPYGRSSSTRGFESIRLAERLLERIDSLIHLRKGRVCVCGNMEMNLPQLVEDNGFQVGYDIKIRVHSGLVREVVTIKC